jgi:hypothetical protein
MVHVELGWLSHHDGIAVRTMARDKMDKRIFRKQRVLLEKTSQQRIYHGHAQGEVELGV